MPWVSAEGLYTFTNLITQTEIQLHNSPHTLVNSSSTIMAPYDALTALASVSISGANVRHIQTGTQVTFMWVPSHVGILTYSL